MAGFGRFGAGMGRLGAAGYGGTSADPLAPGYPDVPSLDLQAASDSGALDTDNITSDTTPNFTVTFAVLLEENDIVYTYDSGVEIDAHTVTAGEAASSTLDLGGLAALSQDTHYISVAHSRGGHTSGRSNTITLVVDATAPTLSAASGVQLAQTTATLSVSTNEASGTLYYVVTTSATPPSAAQVKAGQNDGGTAAMFAGSQAISSTGVKTATATSVTVGTRYAYFMHEDAAGNQSSVATDDWAQADITAPSNPTLSPLDNATGIGLSDSLTLTFAENVSWGSTVSILIKKTSDNSTFESFTEADVGTKPTGNGTTTLTINPAGTYTASEQYYVQITSGSIEDSSGNDWTGISDTTSWSFTATASSFGLTKTDTAVSATNANAYTFSGKNLGSSTSNKEVIVCIYGRSASGTPGPLASLTVDGQSAVEDRLTVNAAGANTLCGIYRATVTATTGDIVVTFAVGSVMLHCAITVYELTMRGSGPNVAGATNNTNVSLTKIAGGVSVGMAGSNSTTSVDSTAATALTIDDDTVLLESPYKYSSGHSTGDSAGATTTGLVFSYTGTGFAQASAYAAYGP